MAKKADVLGDECSGWRSIRDCAECPEYDMCDECGRRTCKYVAVVTYWNREPDALICRPCAKSQGWNTEEIKTQAANVGRPSMAKSKTTVHWLGYSQYDAYAACGIKRWLTSEFSCIQTKVTCGNCKRTKAYKKEKP